MLLFVVITLIARIIQCKIQFFSPYGFSKIHSAADTIEGASTGTMVGDGIKYRNGGDVMKGPVNVYIVFYGSNWPPARRFKVENFVKNMHHSSYFSIIKNYNDKSGNITGPLILKPSIWISHESGTYLTVADITSTFQSFYPNIDKNGIYTFLTDNSTDVGATSTVRLCTHFCGFHTIHSSRKVTRLL